MATRGDVRNNHFGRPVRLQIAGLIWKPYDGVGVPDVQVPGIRTGRIERNAERLIQPGCVNGHLFSAQDFDLAVSSRLGEEHIAVRACSHETWIRKPGREQLNLEASGCDRHRTVGTRYKARSVRRGGRG